MATITELRTKAVAANPINPDTVAKSQSEQLTPEALAFLEFIENHGQAQKLPEELPRVQVGSISSSIATLYEQLRNTIDSTEQHLLRRNAIFRFLKRHVIAYGTRSGMGELLVRELITSDYIPNNTFPERDVEKIELIIQKYLVFIEEIKLLSPQESAGSLERWGLSLAAAELEQTFYSPAREEALLQFGVSTLKKRIQWEDNAIAPEERDMQLYIGLHRAIFSSDAMLLEYHLLSSYLPSWKDLSIDVAPQMARFAMEQREMLRKQIHHPQGVRLAQRIRRMTIPLQAFLDVAIANPHKAMERLQNTETFIADTVNVVEGYYYQNRKATRRSAFRSILFILITKTLVALAIEVPYDLWVVDSIRYMPLAINIAFHPIMIFVLGTTVKFPNKNNTKRIINDLRATIISGKRPQPYFIRLKNRRSKTGRLVLVILYALTFSATFGALIYGLTLANFGLLGGTVFILFLSLVTFVGIRLRTRARKYFMVRRKDSLAGAFFWFFANPFAEVGRWFSTRFAQYNLFLFFFDIILEAPLKALTYGIEEWFRFARERNEEILD